MPNLKFKHLSTTDNEGYVDYDFADNSPRSDLRLWHITHDLETDEWWGMMRRSDTSESDFGDGVYISARMVAAIRRDNKGIFND